MFFTLALIPTIARSETTSGDLDIILIKLQNQMQQMRSELNQVHQELTSTRTELDLMKRSAVHSK